MKSMILAFTLLAATLSVQADSRTFGTLIGTGSGLVVANNVKGLSPWIAAPVGAVAGNHIASRYSHHGHRSYGYNTSPYYSNGYDDGFGFPYGYYSGALPPVSSQPTSRHRPKSSKKIRSLPATDLQPGIDLVKVSILNSNGLRTEIPILRIKDKFVGPQGEEYTTLPTAETLAKLYGM